MIGALALLPIAAFAYQYYSAKREEQENPPPGELIDVGGYRLHINCRGEPRPGVPTVIFESGIWGCSLDWQLVQPEIAKVTQVISYDRAGYGWSDKGPCPRTFDQMSRELDLLLTKKGIQPPYIFVGHSLGGPIARYYQAMHPEQVLGLILVDTVHEDDPSQFSRIYRIVSSVFYYLSYFGALRCIMARMPTYTSNPAWTPTMQKTYLAAHHTKMKSFATLFEEWDNCRDSLQKLKKKKRHLGDRHVIVIPRGPEKLLRPGMSRQENEKMYQDGLKMQKKLLEESSHSELRIASHSGHVVQLDRPEVIIDAIRDMLRPY